MEDKAGDAGWEKECKVIMKVKGAVILYAHQWTDWPLTGAAGGRTEELELEPATSGSKPG